MEALNKIAVIGNLIEKTQKIAPTIKVKKKERKGKKKEKGKRKESERNPMLDSV